ncbi:MAG: lytic transglycosylase domain-containing protein [Deltaproteobacteria bacterium]|nr:lytic transglycosylase domain-containing protein [Deltaproteobacteria bacterium]
MKILYGAATRSFQHNLTALGERYPGKDFDTILNNAAHTTEKENAALLGKGALEALVMMIEQQVREHCICSRQTNSGGWEYAGSWGTGMRYVQDLLPSINRHQSQQEQISAAGKTMDRIIDRSSEKYGVDVDLIRAVIRAESDFDPRATSPKGAMGLMQLMPETARDLGVEDPYDPAQNVLAGTRYLKMLLDRYDGNADVALAAYNWGMGNVERNPGSLPEETKTYITRITGYRNQAMA